MADDGQEAQILAYEEDNTMDGEQPEVHEMADINGDVPGKEGVEPEAGLSNDAYERDEETGLVLNDSENKHTVRDSGIEVDGTDSEPNGDCGARSVDEIVDEEDGLFKSGETPSETGAITSPADSTEVDSHQDPGLESTADETGETPSDTGAITSPANSTEVGSDQDPGSEFIVEGETPSDTGAITSPANSTEVGSDQDPGSKFIVETGETPPETGAITSPANPTEVESDQDPKSEFIVEMGDKDVSDSEQSSRAVTPSETETATVTEEEEIAEASTVASAETAVTDEDTGEISISSPHDSAKVPSSDIPTSSNEDTIDDQTDAVATSLDYVCIMNTDTAPWPEASPVISEEDHFVYVSSLDPGMPARSEDTDITDTISNSSEEIPYNRLHDAEPEPPTPPELNDELNTTIEEPAEWPAPPTPISPVDLVDAAVSYQRSLEPPYKPRRNVTGMQYENPIMAYEIDLEDFEGGRENEGFEADDKVVNEETSFKDNGQIPTVQENSVDQEGTMNNTETATEYENQSTIKSYQNEGELETPEYTPPGSPNHTERHTAINMENGTDEDKIKFVQYEGADDETTRLESRAKFKRKTDWKCICLSMLCFLVMILAAAFAFFIAMFLLGSLNEVFGRDNSPTSTMGPPALPTGRPTIQAPPIDMITVLTQINMVQDWNIAYDFPSSPERTQLENDVIKAMDNTFRWGNTKYVYEKTEIEEFRQGPNGESIYVRFRSSFYDVPGGVLSAPMDSTTPSPDALYEQAREEMAYAVISTLAAAIDAGRLESIGAAQGTIELLLVDVARG